MTRIQQEADEIAQELEVPIQVEDVCEMLSDDGFYINYNEENLSSKGFEGASFGDRKAAGIIINSNIDRHTRKRFTAMHEVGHVILHIFTERETQFQCTKKDISGGKSLKQIYENEANTFASSLLLPKHILKPLVSRNDLTWAFIKEVADKCDASLQATARRLVALTQEEYTLIIQSRGEVWMPIKSPSCAHFIERNKFPDSLEKTEVIDDAHFPSSWNECESIEWIDNGSPRPPIKYSTIHYPKYGLLMTMLYMPEADDWDEDEDDEWEPPHF